MTDSMKKGFFAGIDLGGTKILTVVTDSEKKVLAKTKIPTEAALPRSAIPTDSTPTPSTSTYSPAEAA